MTYRTGVAGGLAAAAAMAAHLNQKTLPDEQLTLAEYYAGGPEREARAREAIAAGMNALPTVRADLDPRLAQALAIKADALVDTQGLGNILRGQAADGEDLPVAHAKKRVFRSQDGDASKDRHRISYMDLTFSAPKSVSVAWFAAKTDAERNSIVQAHRAAVDAALRYIEKEVAVGYFGKARSGGTEPAKMAWIRVDHFTSRPTVTVTRPDPTTGVVDTELYDVPGNGLMRGDPQLHSHGIVPNMLVTESGRFVAMNRDLFDGRVKEFGSIYQMVLGSELAKLGIDVELDRRTLAVRLPCVPEKVCAEFSKRTEQALEAAREMAKQQGQDWDRLSPDAKVAMLKARAMTGRKGKGDDLASWEEWQRQARAMIAKGEWWDHESAMSYGPPAPEQSRDERFNHAYDVLLEILEPDLNKRAVVTGADVRAASARAMIEARAESVEDMRTLANGAAHRGVRQDGRMTKMLWREQANGQVKVTTELHRDQEEEVIRLARDGAANTSRALSPEAIQTAIAEAGFDYSSEHGQKQVDVIKRASAQGEVGVFLGAAGIGKTSRILPPMVAAWQKAGMEVWGVAPAWKAARELQQAGIGRLQIRALQPFLDGVKEGRTKLTANSVVVVDELSQVGTRQLLDLLRLREQIGFKVMMTGDERQCQSVESGPVIELLRKGLGNEAIPEILSTIRQRTEREQELATKFRSGKQDVVREALDAKREDGSARLVPGSYQECVDAVADLWMDRTRSNHNDPDYTVTISAPSNADALNISRSVRSRLQAEGRVARQESEHAACDGAGNLYTLSLAVGDKVRLFQKTRGLFTDEKGRRKDAHVGDNGSVLTLRGAQAEGLLLETESGKVALVRWDRLQDRATGRLKLAYGYCLTIDSSQGQTSDEHIFAMPAGSQAVEAFKAYVAASRHRIANHIVGSRGAEMLEVGNRRPIGPRRPVTDDEAWANVARNLARQPLKELATDMLARVAHEATRTSQTLQRVTRLQEARERAGQALSTLRENIQWEKAKEALVDLAGRLEAVMRERAPLLAKLHEAVKKPALDAVQIKLDQVYRVTVRGLSAGTISFSDAVESLVSAELKAMAEKAEIDPVHQTAKVGLAEGELEEIEERADARLMDMLDAYETYGEAAFRPNGPARRDLEAERLADAEAHMPAPSSDEEGLGY